MKIINNKYFIFFLIIITIFYLLYSNLIYDYFVPQDKTKYLGLFRDWIITLNDTYCEIQTINYDCRPFQYGPILIYLPFSNFLKNFYYLIVPNLSIILFVISIFFIFAKYFSQNKFLIFCIIFSPTSLLALERGNLDLHLFLIAFLISYNKFFYINLFLISFSFLLKYYPITFFINLFTEKKKSKKFILILFILSLFSSILFIFYHYKIFLDLIYNLDNSKAGYHLIYSIKSIAKVLRYLFSLNYIILLLITYIFFIFTIYKLIKFIYKTNLDKIVSIYSFEEKLFLIGANTSLFTYLIFSNVYYREVFLILCIPFILKLKERLQLLKIFRIIIYLIIFRYLFLHIHNYTLLIENHFHIDGVRIFNKSFILTLFIKSLLDYFFMAFISSLLFFQNKKIINFYLNLKKKI